MTPFSFPLFLILVPWVEFLGTRSIIFLQIVQRVRYCPTLNRNPSNNCGDKCHRSTLPAIFPRTTSRMVHCNKPSGTSGRSTPNNPSQSSPYSNLNTHPPKCVGCHQWFWIMIAKCWVSAANPKCPMNQQWHSAITSPCKITWGVYRQQPTNPL